MSAIILYSKSHSGYRKRIYQDAALHGALYDVRSPGCSIWGRPPRFKIEYESTGPSLMCQGMTYFMIRVLLTFNDPAMARAMEGRWREGTTAHGDLRFRSYFYTRNVEDCKKYLALKQGETEDRWAALVEDI